MIALAAVLAAALVAPEADPCAPVAPLSRPDPPAAADYRAVGEAELARGDRDTAAAAFRAALARDPDDAASRDALARLCAAPQRPRDAFAEGVRLMDAGDLRGAIAAFRTLPGDPSAALLEGICHHDLGDDEAAAPLLRAAASSPPHREVASLYLGLAALRAGAAGEAASLFDAAAASPSISRVARDLARRARRDGRLVVSLLAESGWDTNVNLAPSGPVGAAEDDGSFALVASALLRPRGVEGPYVRAAGALHRQLSLGAYDLGGLDAAAGWQARLGALSLLGEYGYGRRTLGGLPFLDAHRLLASAALLRRGVAVSATYLARFEDYATGWEAFSGVLHRAEARVSFPLGDRGRLSVGYGVGRDLAEEEVVSYAEHGPRAELRVALGSRTRVGVEAELSARAYDAYDAALGARRRDLALEGAALVERDLGARLTARASLLARRVGSNVPEMEYDKVMPALGLSWTAGLW